MHEMLPFNVPAPACRYFFIYVFGILESNNFILIAADTISSTNWICYLLTTVFHPHIDHASVHRRIFRKVWCDEISCPNGKHHPNGIRSYFTFTLEQRKYFYHLFIYFSSWNIKIPHANGCLTHSCKRIGETERSNDRQRKNRFNLWVCVAFGLVR